MIPLYLELALLHRLGLELRLGLGLILGLGLELGLGLRLGLEANSAAIDVKRPTIYYLLTLRCFHLHKNGKPDRAGTIVLFG